MPLLMVVNRNIILFLFPDNLVKGPSTANGPTQEPWCPRASVCSTSPWGVPTDPRGLALRIHLPPACLISLLPLQTLFLPPMSLLSHTHTHIISLLDFKQLQQPPAPESFVTRRKVAISPHPYPYLHLCIPGGENRGQETQQSAQSLAR